MKKLLSSIVSTIIVVVQIGAPAASVGAQTSPNTDVSIVSYGIQTQESSEFGYADYKYVDENGNEVVFEKDSSNNNLFYAPVLPSSYDSRAENYITTPKNQGSTGSCWAFSTLSALETDSIVQGIDDVNSADYSEAHFVWFNKNSLVNNEDDTTSGDGSTNTSPYKGMASGGNWFKATHSLARWAGAAEENDYPFYPSDVSAMGNYDESSRYDTGSGIVIKSSEVLLGTTDVKEWIMEHGSVTATYYTSNSYYNTDTYAYYYNGSEEAGNHQIVIVGWDDDYSVDNFKASNKPASNGAWLCKNSWGDDWGLDGYFWISYEDYRLENFVGFTAQSTDDLYNNYSYNGNGYNKTIGISMNYVTVANVFQAEGHEILTSVSTYTLSADSDVTFKIYKGLDSNYTTPVKGGTLAASWSTNIAREGYHTIDVPKEITLEPGEFFSVIMTVEKDSGYAWAPVEVGSSYTSNSRESYLNVGDWVDTKVYAFKNVCIQAFTECNHQAETVSSPATCTENGYEKTTCSQCGELISEKIILALGHNSAITTTGATCTEDGCKKTVCTTCGEVISNIVIQKTGHQLKTTSVAATCTKDGYEKISCTVCGEVISNTVIKKTGHKFETTTVAATCTKNGYTKTSCTVCGEVTSEEIIPLLEHQYGEWSPYVKNSKTGRMESERFCEVCGSKMGRSYISGGNVVTLDELLDRIWDSFRDTLKSWRKKW